MLGAPFWYDALTHLVALGDLDPNPTLQQPTRARPPGPWPPPDRVSPPSPNLRASAGRCLREMDWLSSLAN